KAQLGTLLLKPIFRRLNMQQRLAPQELYTLLPRIPKHLRGLGETSPNSAITPQLRHLIDLRVSQLNHCCFCQHMHTEEARQDGERQVRLDVLAAWREAPCFTAQERAALAWAEALTLLATQPIPAQAYEDALALFGMRDLLELSTVVLQINSWNRLAVSLQVTPVIEEQVASVP